MVGLPGFDGNDSNPLFPDANGFLSNEDLEGNWLSF